MRLMLQDQMQEGSVLLRQDGDGDHHRHELLPGGALPLRPQRHGVRQARQARPQRQAPPLRHHRHRVHQGSVRVPGTQDRVPRGGVLEPRLLRGAGGVRGRRRRRGPGRPDGVARPRRREVDADEGVVGIHLAPRLQPPPPGTLLHPHPQRVREDARRQQGHPGQLEAQHLLPLFRAVQLKLKVSSHRPAVFGGVLVMLLLLYAASCMPRSSPCVASSCGKLYRVVRGRGVGASF